MKYNYFISLCTVDQSNGELTSTLCLSVPSTAVKSHLIQLIYTSVSLGLRLVRMWFGSLVTGHIYALEQMTVDSENLKKHMVLSLSWKFLPE